jgi:hypothetical protein
MVNDLAQIGIVFLIVMVVVLYQAFNRHSWFWNRKPPVLWHGKKWHYERHEACDGIGTVWWNPQEGRWTAIPKDLRTKFPSLGNTKKCGCVMGRVIRVNEDPDKLSKQYQLPPKRGRKRNGQDGPEGPLRPPDEI